MCREAPKAVYELEHFGMPFDRNPDGTIYQRPFGGHTANLGEKPVQRACAAADRTGHALLHTLYQRNVRAKTHFFVEWMALDLIRNEEGDVLGVVALEMETGEIMMLHAKTTLFATGGAGRIWAASTLFVPRCGQAGYGYRTALVLPHYCIIASPLHCIIVSLHHPFIASLPHRCDALNGFYCISFPCIHLLLRPCNRTSCPDRRSA